MSTSLFAPDAVQQVKRALPKPDLGPPPDGPPVPVLAQQGWLGSIGQFAARVQAITQAHENQFGYRPDPTTVLKTATDPNVPDKALPNLFRPVTPTSLALAAVKTNNQLVTRQDGMVERNNPLRPAAPATTTLQKSHPWVSAGMLPLPTEMLNSFWHALATVGENQNLAKPLIEGGMTIQQYTREAQLAQQVAGTAGGTIGTTGAPVGMAPEFRKYFPSSNPADQAAANTQAQIAQGAQTIKQTQDHLKQIAPEYFGDLPSGGFINSDWAGAISKYQSSAQYYQQQTVQIAHDNHFGNDTGAFIRAWSAKQNAIRKNPAFAIFLRAQPVAAFNGGMGPLFHLFTGDTKGFGWTDLATVPLQTLSHTVGFALSEIGGTYTQLKADAAAGHAYLQAITPKPVGAVASDAEAGFVPAMLIAGGKGDTEAEARKRAATVLQENPTWLRILYPDLEAHPKGLLGAVDQLSNFAIDLLAAKPGITGERVAAGDIAAAKNSRYFNTKTSWAFNTLVKHGEKGVAEASASLEPGLAAEKLNAYAAPKVADGTMNEAQYKHLAAELFSKGQVTLDNGTVIHNDGILKSLLTRDMTTPGRVGTTAQAAHAQLSGWIDTFENTLRRNKEVGSTNHAADVVSGARQVFARAAPKGELRHLYDGRLPQDIYNWTRVNLKDQQLAGELRNDFVTARAAESTPGMLAVEKRMQELYAKAYPNVKGKPTPFEKTSGPEVESELPTYMYFPAGREKQADSFLQTIENTAHDINQKLLSFGKVARATVVGGSPIFGAKIPGFGESLFWKHTVADTTRRIAGGGGVFGLDKDAQTAKDAVGAWLKENPEGIRNLGVQRAGAVMGEQRWMDGIRYQSPASYQTGEFLSDKARMEAAGGYLRRTVTSKALKAYQDSTSDNLKPLVDLIMGDKNWRALAMNTDAYKDEAKATRDAMKLFGAGPSERVGAMQDLAATHAQAYAELLFRRYRDLEKAAGDAGISDPYGAILDTLVKNVGPKADVKLGQWIAKNKIDLPVRDGLVAQSQWDDWMSGWIGKLMTANKWNRGKLFDHVLYNTVGKLTDAGWDMQDSVATASSLAKAQTVAHMLDFSNMLQVEQDLRWISYFSTKHRLYWTWVGKYILRHPGTAGAISDVQQHVDKYGNLNFSLFGGTGYVPVARLFWANSSDYPQTSPIIQVGAKTAKNIAEGQSAGQAVSGAVGSLTATSGNVLTRDDQAEAWALKWALVGSGKMQPTASVVTAGLNPSQTRAFNEQVNEYATHYRNEHGTWPAEGDAVKHTLIYMSAQTFWSANMFLPVLWKDNPKPPKIQALLDTYSRIVSPKLRREFLDQHPAVAQQFGITSDPTVFIHNGGLWDKFNAAQTQLQQQRHALYEQVRETGKFTVDTSLAMSKLSAAWTKTIDQLRLEDALTWQGSSQYPAGKVSDGRVVQEGPWGTSLDGDPFAARAFVHQASPGVPKAALDGHTVGAIIVSLENEAAQLRHATPAQWTKLGYPDAQHVHDRLSQINQQLAPFFAYPKDALAKLQDDYYSKFVGPYITARDKRTAAVALLPADQQDAARSELRAWKDSHDHPVTIGGTTFPSVVQIGWQRLPAAQRQLGLSQAAADDWSHVASYEKTMLGVKTGPDVGKGWAAYYDAVRQYENVPANKGLVRAQRDALAHQIDSVYHGFYKDYVFSNQPKIVRYTHTTLYRDLPDKALFDQYVRGPADKIIAAIKTNGNRTYYARAWRQYVQGELVPWLQGQPDLKRALVDYGPNFLNTLVG